MNATRDVIRTITRMYMQNDPRAVEALAREAIDVAQARGADCVNHADLQQAVNQYAARVYGTVGR